MSERPVLYVSEPDDDGCTDEIISFEVTFLHLERLSKHRWYGRIETAEGSVDLQFRDLTTEVDQ